MKTSQSTGRDQPISVRVGDEVRSDGGSIGIVRRVWTSKGYRTDENDQRVPEEIPMMAVETRGAFGTQTHNVCRTSPFWSAVERGPKRTSRRGGGRKTSQAAKRPAPMKPATAATAVAW